MLTGDLAFQGVGQVNLEGTVAGGPGALAGNLRAQAGVNTPPVVTFAVSTMRVDGRGTVVLTGSATDTQDAESALVFSWSAPSGTFRDSSNASTVWTAPLPTTLEQSVSLTLTVTDTGGLSGTARVTIFVNAGAAPQPTPAGLAWNRPPGLRSDWAPDVWSDVPAAWTSFDGRARAFFTDRGRGSEIDDPIVGTLNLSLDNVSGDYWAVEAATAPGAGGKCALLPPTTASTTTCSPACSSHSTRRLRMAGARPWFRLPATGGARLNRRNRSPTQPDIRSNAPTYASPPCSTRSAGRRRGASLTRGRKSSPPPGRLTRRAPGDLLRQAQAVEFGRSYVGVNGAYVFRNRSASLPTPAIVLGPADSPMFAPLFEHTDRLVVNRASVMRDGGTAQQSDDTTSQARYGVRASEVVTLPVTSDVVRAELGRRVGHPLRRAVA